MEHASQTSGHTISLEQTSVSTSATMSASTMNSSTATMSNLTFTSASGTALSAQTGTFSTSLAVSNAGASKLTVDATGVNASNLKIGGGNAVVSQAGAITASSLMAAGLVADSSGTTTGPLQSTSVTVPNVATLSTAGVASQVHVTALQHQPFLGLLTYGEQGVDPFGVNRHANLMYALLRFGGD